jgi:hypothetical protein
MSIVTQSVRNGIGAISTFGSVLNELLDSFDEQLANANKHSSKFAEDMSLFKDELSIHELRIRKLEVESNEQRDVVENAMSQVLGIEKTVDSQLSDATRQLHKELMAQRTMTKMDLSQLRGKLHSSMNEAMFMMNESTRASLNLGSSPNTAYLALDPTKPEESIQLLNQRLNKLEEALGLQHRINQEITK